MTAAASRFHLPDDHDLDAIELAGSRAAQAGHRIESNPYLLPGNMPDATGVSLEVWTRLHDAWHDGFERARRAVPGRARRRKERAGPALLMLMVNRRLRWVPVVRVELEQRAGAVLRVKPPAAHPADADERTWDIDDFECGGLRARDCAESFRSIVDRLRDEFDLR